jgi:transcriptional regulator with XRE-family HTH domain
MERRYSNYIREWRQKNGLSQKALVARLIELCGEGTPDDPELRIPTTEASLSRIENGKQNFNMATLHALADALGAEEPGWLLTRNPMKEGEVVPLFNHLTPEEQERARAVILAMFPTKQANG